MERVGFIGLGIMGRPMATNLLTAGVTLTVHSRSIGPVDELAAAGAARAATPREVAAASDIVITMLPDSPEVEAVVLGEGGLIDGAEAGGLVIDMSTIDPDVTRRVASALTERGVDALDAPVSGGERGAIDGTLSIMVGGESAAFERARPLFDILGSKAVHIGPAGAGQVAKACNQLVVASTIEAVAEAIALAERAGVDAARVREVLLGGFAGSKILEVHGQRMLDRAFEPGFRVRLHAKDARIIRDLAREVDLSLPGFEPVAAALDRLASTGGGELDHSGLYTLL